MMKPQDHRVGKTPLVGIFLTALAVSSLHLWQASGSPLFSVLLGDAEGYNAWARQIAAGNWIGSEVFYQAPLYPYVVAVLYAATGADFRLILVLQGLLHACSCVLLTAAAARWVSRRGA